VEEVEGMEEGGWRMRWLMRWRRGRVRLVILVSAALSILVTSMDFEGFRGYADGDCEQMMRRTMMTGRRERHVLVLRQASFPHHENRRQVPKGSKVRRCYHY